MTDDGVENGRNGSVVKGSVKSEVGKSGKGAVVSVEGMMKSSRCAHDAGSSPC